MSLEQLGAAARDALDVSPLEQKSYVSQHQASHSPLHAPHYPQMRSSEYGSTDVLHAVLGHELHKEKLSNSTWYLSATDPPEGWLQKTPNGFWVGSVFIPKAWLTDKFHEGRLDQAMLWTMYFSRVLTAAIPIAITFVALVVSVSKKGCECAPLLANDTHHLVR
jgi:hypothetical protein